jgi:hypothetical protein
MDGGVERREEADVRVGMVEEQFDRVTAKVIQVLADPQAVERLRAILRDGPSGVR